MCVGASRSSASELTLEVARLYRNLGSTARATEVATKLFGSAPAAVRSEAAVLLGLLTEADEATSERWYREADPASLFARNALLELDARRAMREGQWQRCATLFAQSAKASLEHASAVNSAGYNNAATAYMRAFGCSADVAWLDKAEAAMTRAHQLTPADPIVVGNLVAVLRNRATVRALGRRVDVAALGLDSATARAVVSTLLDRDTAAVIGAELAADRAWVRARALAAQVVVLAPNNPDAYELGFEDAAVRRDVVAATALIEQLRRARALDTSAAADARRRAQSAADDAQDRAALGAYRDRLSAALARRDLDDRTRAVGHLVRGVVQSRLAVIDGAAATADACGQDLAEAARRWPALDVAHGALACAIDAIALADRDAERWRQDRRATDAIGALGLEVDLASRTIRTEGDLDLWAWRSAERRVPVFPVLGLPTADVLTLAIKGSALWSLRLNARDHAAVREVCRAEADRPGGAGRRLLREPVASDAAPFQL